ncbi:MAG TPA: hypothetical protein PKW51_03035 [Methanoregulaceae archaeon]|nr:hypothetical protein [Methanoregulaceae archaeon]
MDLKTAIKTYQFAERAKSELIVCSQLLNALAGFPEQERPGAKRMLLLVIESVRSELEFAFRDTERVEFKKGIGFLNEVISLSESDQYGSAVLKLSEAISAATTAAQGAWKVLADYGLL